MVRFFYWRLLPNRYIILFHFRILATVGELWLYGTLEITARKRCGREGVVHSTVVESKPQNSSLGYVCAGKSQHGCAPAELKAEAFEWGGGGVLLSV